MSKSIIALAYEAGLRPFEQNPTIQTTSRSLGDMAAAMLAGRSDYFNKEFRDRFGTRVHALEPSHSRLLLCCVESAQPAAGGDRHYRAVIFRCDGEVLYQTPDNRVLDMNAATVDMRYNAGKYSEYDLLADLCQKQIKDAERKIKSATHVLNMVNKQGP